MEIIEILKLYKFAGNDLYEYSIALCIFIAVLFLLKIFQTVVLVKLKKLAQRTSTDIDNTFIDIFRGIGILFYFIVALYAGVRYISLPEVVDRIMNVLLIVIIVYEIIEAIKKIIKYAVFKYLGEDEKGQHTSLLNMISYGATLILWALGLLVILSNVGIDVTSLVASLGIGGIAIALAVKNILSDLLSSVSIFVDKPFEQGDHIVFGDKSGTVENIGLKTTRVRLLRGEELIVPNEQLTSAQVQNLKRMEKRRDLFKFGVVYETDSKKLRQIPKIVKEIIGGIKGLKFDRCHFVEYGDFSLNFEVVYYCDTPQYKKFLDAKQKVNLELFKRFEKEGIVFAYPTQVVYLEKNKE